MATYELGPDHFVIARTEDLLYLDVRLDDDGLAVVLDFPSQHVMEFPNGAALSTAHQVPALGADRGFNFISYNVDTASTMALGERLLARLDRQPGRGHVELPAMVQLRTRGDGTWNLSPRPRTGGGWTAVWCAELLETLRELPGVPGRLLEVFNTQDPGFEPNSFAVEPFTLYPQFRGAVFQASLSMSMLGASARIHGLHFPPGQEEGGLAVTVKSYDHNVQFGRDQGITTVLRGALSSGHPAELSLVTRREFARMKFVGPPFFPTGTLETSGPYVAGHTYFSARLLETATLTITDPVVSFEGTDTPFRSLRVNAGELGQIDLPTPMPPAFWVTRGSADVHFGLVATDWSGREVPFSAPLMFLRADAASSPQAVTDEFMSGAPARREINLGGAPVTLADIGGRDDVNVENLTLPVHRVALDLKATALGAGRALVPTQVDVALDAVGRLTEKARLARCDLLHHIDEFNHFLTIAGGLPVTLPAAQVGGLANPDTMLRAVDALKGAVPFGSVADMFGGAKVLGVSILSLLPDLPGPPPELTSVKVPDKVTTTYEWTPTLKTGQTSGTIRLKPDSKLHLKATAIIAIDPTAGEPRPPTIDVEGVLTKAKLSLLDLIEVSFEEVKFEDHPGRSPSVTVSGVGVTFAGNLKFVDEFAKKIKDFASGSPIELDSSAITAGYDTGNQSLMLGAFSLANIKLGAKARIPFDGEPASVRFNFGERHAPFTVTVYYFAGGGFFGLKASAAKLELVEASLEFGGRFDISVLVATGQVYAMAGVSLLFSGETVEFTGYLRAGGHVEVLDLVQVSIEFEMGLHYKHDPTGGKVFGRADLTVAVSVLLFHESVSFSVEKEFPTDGVLDSPQQLMFDETAWDQLCDAFA